MTRNVLSVPAELPVARIATLMSERKCSCVVVVRGERPIGIISERDIVRLYAQLARDPVTSFHRAADVMSAPVLAISRTERLDVALEALARHNIRRLPVVDAHGNLVGLVTQTDLARAQFDLLRNQHATLESVVSERTELLVRANTELEALTMQDRLLGTGNRRALDMALDAEHAAAMRYSRRYSVALVDVDHFKSFNDTYGHLAGDEALKRVARTIESNKRNVDRLFRYGGEELLLLLTETDLAGARVVGARTVEAIAATSIPHERGQSKVLTVSVGVASFRPSDKTWEGLLARADAALYRAKDAGRNRMEFDDPAPPRVLEAV